jgi:uncharacterized membrane protein
MARNFFVALASFVVLDTLWLGVIMKQFYRAELGPIARTAADGSLAPIWAAAIPVYAILALGIAVFVAPRFTLGSTMSADGYGALFGWLVFGLYDLTNLATLKNYSVALTIVDIMWGDITCGLTALVVRKFGA